MTQGLTLRKPQGLTHFEGQGKPQGKPLPYSLSLSLSLSLKVDSPSSVSERGKTSSATTALRWGTSRDAMMLGGQS